MTENTLFPGRESYTGSTSGWFGLLHHSELCEKSHNVMERVEYVKNFKPRNEVEIRLHNMIYLGGCEAIAKRDALDAKYIAKRDALDAKYIAKRDALYAKHIAKRDALDAKYKAKRDPLDAEYTAKRDALYAKYKAKRDPLDAEYTAKRDPLYAEYIAKRDPLDAELLLYIQKYIPDCAWSTEKGELQF